MTIESFKQDLDNDYEGNLNEPVMTAKELKEAREAAFKSKMTYLKNAKKNGTPIIIESFNNGIVDVTEYKLLIDKNTYICLTKDDVAIFESL